MSIHERVYRSLLVVYPQEHRRAFGDDMALLFADRLRDEGGGVRTGLLWAHTALDLIGTALTERLEMTMQTMKTGWWRWSAVVVSLLTAVLGILNLIGDTEGALFGRVAYAAIAGLGMILVVAGTVLRRRSRMWGSTMIGIGLIPGFVLTLMFWFPPVALIGVLAIVTSLFAFLDAPKSDRLATEQAGS